MMLPLYLGFCLKAFSNHLTLLNDKLIGISEESGED